MGLVPGSASLTPLSGGQGCRDRVGQCVALSSNASDHPATCTAPNCNHRTPCRAPPSPPALRARRTVCSCRLAPPCSSVQLLGVFQPSCSGSPGRTRTRAACGMRNISEGRTAGWTGGRIRSIIQGMERVMMGPCFVYLGLIDEDTTPHTLPSSLALLHAIIWKFI